MRFPRRPRRHRDGCGGAEREAELVRQYGWAVRHVSPVAGVPDGEVAFSYTIGLTAMGHPEVITTGLPFESAHGYFDLVVEEVRAGRRFEHGLVTDALTDAGSPVVFLRVEDTGRLTAVEELYGSVDAVQLVWADSAGRLPWQPGHRNPPGTQPLLGRLPDGV